MLGGFLSQGKFLDIPGALSSSEAVNFIVGLGRSGKVFGVKSICEICHTPYNHSHSCKYYCQLCLLREQALNHEEMPQLHTAAWAWATQIVWL